MTGCEVVCSCFDDVDDGMSAMTTLARPSLSSARCRCDDTAGRPNHFMRSLSQPGRESSCAR